MTPTGWEVNVLELGAVSVPICERCLKVIGAPRKALKQQKEREPLIPAKEIETLNLIQAQRVRNELLNIPNKVAEKLADETDPALVTQVLADEFERVFSNYGN